MMRTSRIPSLLLAALLAATLSFLSGCTSGPAEKEVQFSPVAVRSTDGMLSYQVPAGWLDASADSASRGFAVWLLRPDYQASIAVSEVHLDADARRTILSGGGILELARLTMELATGTRTGVVEEQPEEMRINGVPACRYAVRTASEGFVRTVLLQIDGRFYAVTSLAPAREKGEAAAVQQAFLDTLHW